MVKRVTEKMEVGLGVEVGGKIEIFRGKVGKLVLCPLRRRFPNVV